MLGRACAPDASSRDLPLSTATTFKGCESAQSRPRQKAPGHLRLYPWPLAPVHLRRIMQLHAPALSRARASQRVQGLDPKLPPPLRAATCLCVMIVQATSFYQLRRPYPTCPTCPTGLLHAIDMLAQSNCCLLDFMACPPIAVANLQDLMPARI